MNYHNNPTWLVELDRELAGMITSENNSTFSAALNVIRRSSGNFILKQAEFFHVMGAATDEECL